MTERRPPDQQRQEESPLEAEPGGIGGQRQESPLEAERGSTQAGQRQESPLQTEQGNTRIEDSVVSKIAGIAAQEVDGVRMGGGATQAIGGILSSVTGGSESRGVSVEVGQVEAAVDLTMTVRYGLSIPQISDAVRRNVINRIENLVGLSVREVNIS